MPRISQLPIQSSPSTSTSLVGVDNGETVRVPITELVMSESTDDTVISSDNDIIINSGKRADILAVEHINIESDGANIRFIEGGDIEVSADEGIDLFSDNFMSLAANGDMTIRSEGNIAVTSSEEVKLEGKVACLYGKETVEMMAGENDESSVYATAYGIQIISPETNVGNVNVLSTKSNGTGQAGQVLTTDGTNVYWSDPSGDSGGSRYSEGLRYLLTTDKTGYDVVGIGTCTDTDIIVPPIYEGLPVKKIGFQNVTTITSLTLPNTIVSMGHYVFKGCSNLRKMNIPDSVTTIGQDIFNECPNVTVYCEAKSKPEGWHSTWGRSARHVVWNAFDFIGVHEHIENDLSEYVTEAELDEKLSSLPSGGSGDSSIIDLGEQGNHKDAQQAIVDHLTQMNAEDGCYLFKYYCSCYGNACFAVVVYTNMDGYEYISGTVYDNFRSFRPFQYDTLNGFILDGCWKEIGSSSGAGLSMPRIRLANHWMANDGIACNKESKEWFGEYVFSVEIMDGTLQEGDQLQICNLTNHKNSRGVRVRKPRRFAERVITAEDIEMLSYNPYLQISVAGHSLREIYRSCSSDGTLYRYPKYIRLRRPKYDEEGQETGATFSNVVCADIRLPVTFFYE